MIPHTYQTSLCQLPFCCCCFVLSTYLDREKESKQLHLFSSSHLFYPPGSPHTTSFSNTYHCSSSKSSSGVYALLPKPKVEPSLASSYLHLSLQPGVRGTTRSQLHREDFILVPCLLPSSAAAGAERWWQAATGEKRPKIMCFRGGNGWSGNIWGGENC